MNLSIARLGSVTNSILSPRISNYFQSPFIAVCVGSLSCYLSLFAAIILIGIMSSELKERDDSETPLLQSERTLEPEKSSVVDNIHKLPSTFWLLCILCILLYGTVIPFNATASDFFTSKWYPNDIETAGLIMRYYKLLF